MLNGYPPEYAVGFVIAAEEASKNPQTLFAFHAGISYNLFSN